MPVHSRVPLLLAADVAAVVLFATVGRRSHGEATAIAGVLQTALPFLGGTAVGWLASRAWRAPATLSTGVVVWPCTVVLGLAMRVAFTDRGAPLSFAIVATIALGVLMMGWRLGAALRDRWGNAGVAT